MTHTPINLYLVLTVLAYPFTMIIYSSIFFIICRSRSFFYTSCQSLISLLFLPCADTTLAITLACYRSTSTVLKILTVLVLCLPTFLIPFLLVGMTELYDLKQRWQERGQDQSTGLLGEVLRVTSLGEAFIRRR